MSKNTIVLLGLLLLTTTALGANESLRPHRGYFFPPPKHLYYFRPDLYVHQVTRPSYGYRYGSAYSPHYGYSYFPGLTAYAPPSYPFYAYPESCVSRGCRGENGYGIYGVVLSPPPTGGVVRANSSDIIFGVRPPRALVYIDGRLIGGAGDFATPRDRYVILDGEHQLRIEYPGFRAFETKLEIVPNRTLHLDIELERLP